MKRLFALLIIASFATSFVPATTAAENVSEEYFTTAGVRVLDQGRAVSWRPCPGGCDIDADDDGNTDATIPDQIKMGGGPLRASQIYKNVILSVNDEIYGTQGSVAGCFWNPDGVTFNICDEEDYGSERTCGTVALLNSPFASDYVTVWVHTVWVGADLTACGGFAGTMTGDFF